MKKFVRLFAVALAFCALSISTANAYAQCIQCKPFSVNPNRLVCTPSASGGGECVTEGQTLCAIVNACGGGGGKPKEPEYGKSKQAGDDFLRNFSLASFHPCMIAQTEKQKASGEVEITSAFLREVGAVHPRFAVALAFLKKHGHLGRITKLSMIPVEVGFRDVERWLAPTPETIASVEDIFRSFDAKAQTTDLQNAPTIVYAFTFKEAPDSSGAVLKLRVIEGFASDPSYSTLELDLASVGSESSGDKKWKATRWRVK